MQALAKLADPLFGHRDHQAPILIWTVVVAAEMLTAKILLFVIRCQNRCPQPITAHVSEDTYGNCNGGVKCVDDGHKRAKPIVGLVRTNRGNKVEFKSTGHVVYATAA
ncbi:hypothetical protein HAX54_024085 [Datura stramonium]|uniref:Uncharacterized protein n=1 Tax=Datura stramonium TaxID=4076 RepID=A0ABS8UZR2_DATST|nr:hypothetical protein [Datura stramonium]